MADLAISGLPIAATLTGVELLPIVQGGITSQTTASAMLTYIGAGLTVSNGLTNVAGNIKWGGALTADTTISGAFDIYFNNNTFQFDSGGGGSLGYLIVGATYSELASYDSASGQVWLIAGTATQLNINLQRSTNEITVYTGASGKILLTSPIVNITSAALTLTSLTASTVPYLNASKILTSSAVTPTELGLLSGLTGFTGTGTLLAKGTSPVFTTDITTPLIYGGTAVGSQLNLQGTSGNGTSTVAAINFLVGNNGGTVAGSVYNDGQLNFGNAAKNGTALGLVRIGQGTAICDIGELASGQTAIWLDQSTPTTTNYSIARNGTELIINGGAASSVYIALNGVSYYQLKRDTFVSTQLAASSGAVSSYIYTLPNNTNQTLSTAIPKVLYTLGSTQWATGALAATQGFFSITQPTISFVGASTATLTATLKIAGAPNSGTNATQTTSCGLLIESAAVNSVGTVTTSYGAYINAATGGTTNFALGLSAGTTTSAPIRLLSGTNLTAAVAGVVEFTTDDFSLTGTTGATRKVIRDLSYRGITALRTLDGSDEFVNCTANTFAVTLPTAVGYLKQYTIHNSGSGIITLNTTSAQTISGIASGILTLNQYDTIVLRSDGANWIKIN